MPCGRRIFWTSIPAALATLGSIVWAVIDCRSIIWAAIDRLREDRR